MLETTYILYVTILQPSLSKIQDLLSIIVLEGLDPKLHDITSIGNVIYKNNII